MRVLTSQGFRDIPDEQLPGGAPGVQAGGQGDLLNQLLGAAVLGGDISGTDVTALQGLGLVKPKKSTTEKKRELILNQSAPVLSNVIDSALAAPTGFKGAFKAQTGKIPGVAGGEAEALRRQTEGFARLIASAFASEVGVATDKDVARWKAIMPQPGDTLQERIDASNRLITQIESESKSLGIDIPRDIVSASAKIAEVQGGPPTGGRPPTPPSGPGGFEAAPVLGGLLGGGIGSLLGPAGLIGGTAAGTAGGGALRELLQDVTGRQDQPVQEQVGGVAKQTGIQTLLSALPTLLSPIKGLSKLRNLIAGRSGATVPGQQVIGRVAEQITGPQARAGGAATLERLLGEQAGILGGKNVSLLDALTRRSTAGTIARNVAGKQRLPVTSQFNEFLRRALGQEIKEVAPAGVGILDKLISGLSKVKRLPGQLLQKIRLPVVGR